MNSDHASRLLPRQEAGSHRDTGSTSVSALISTLIPAFLVAMAFTLGFLILRSKQQRVYAPRTYLEILPEDARTPRSIKGGMLGWISDFTALPDEYVLHHQSMDQYLYLRFLKMITFICLVGCLSWLILFPVNAIGGTGQTELNRLSFSNVRNPNRYYAHVVVAWIYLSFVMFIITSETIYFINLRQAYLMSPLNASRISSRTVLFTDVPKKYLDMTVLRHHLHRVYRIWIASNCKGLDDFVKGRDEVAFRLEKAEIALCEDANKKRMKGKKKKAKKQSTLPISLDVEKNISAASQWIAKKDRPTHRTKPIFGKKVDTIYHCREILPGLIEKTKAEQSKYWNGEKPFLRAIFVEFETQRAAQAAYQMSRRKSPIHATPRAIGVIPAQIVWDNLGMGRADRKLRGYLASLFITLMIIFWSIPVAFVGVLSNINYLADRISFLSFINRIPLPVLGIITGLLPTVLLALLLNLVPMIFRSIATFAGAVTLQEAEMKVQNWYFAFQVIQVFLITTFTSGASAVTTQILANPGSAPLLLAENLPKASNFYISYFILFGLGVASKSLFNIVALLMFNVVGRVMDRSPRNMYKRYINLTGDSWGTSYPKWTNLAVIAISYSCIAPLVLGFAAVCLGLIYLMVRYNSFYTYMTPIDSKGQAYGRALQHLTVGVYLSELCLIGLFAIRIAPTSIPDGRFPTERILNGGTSAGPMVLMILFFFLTILYHLVMRSTLHPLTQTLPNSLLRELEKRHDNQQNHANQTSVPGRTDTSHTPATQINHEERPTTRTSSSEQTRPTANPINAILASEPSHKERSIFTRYLNPYRYSSHKKVQKMMTSSTLHCTPTSNDIPESIASSAYQHPLINSETPTLWIVRDEIGLSKEEVRDSGRVIGITDQGAWFDDKGRIKWDHERLVGCPGFDRQTLINRLI